jgi:hypothetical protein
MALFRWLFTLAAVASTILFYRRGSTAMVVVTIAVGLVELLSRALMQNISDRTAKFLAGHHDKLVASLIKSEHERIQIYKKLAQERNFEPDRAMTNIDEPLIRQAVAETDKTMALKAIPNWLALVNFVASVAALLICVYVIVLTIWR